MAYITSKNQPSWVSGFDTQTTNTFEAADFHELGLIASANASNYKTIYRLRTKSECLTPYDTIWLYNRQYIIIGIKTDNGITESQLIPELPKQFDEYFQPEFITLPETITAVGPDPRWKTNADLDLKNNFDSPEIKNILKELITSAKTPLGYRTNILEHIFQYTYEMRYTDFYNRLKSTYELHLFCKSLS